MKTNITQKELSTLFIRAKKTTLGTKHWYFQYRILTKTLTTNWRASRWDKNISPKCTFCGNYDETVVHLFWDCTVVAKLWKALLKWIQYFHSVKIKLSNAIVIYGNYKGRLSMLINTYILLTKFYIYRCKTQNNTINFSHLVSDFVMQKNMEKCIAIRNDKLYKFARKWDDFTVFS